MEEGIRLDEQGGEGGEAGRVGRLEVGVAFEGVGHGGEAADDFFLANW